MRVIDVHTHIFPESVAERALKELSYTSEVDPFLDGTANGLIESMRKAGIEKSVIAPIATKPSQVKSINNFVANQNRDYFIPLGSLHQDFADIEEEADRLVSLKIPGIKLHSNYQEFYPNDEKMFPIYRAMEERGLIVLFHGGADISFIDVLALPEAIAIVLEKFPKLKVIAAHFGGWKEWAAAEKFLVGKNVYLDTSFTVPDLDLQELKRLIKKHDIEKVLFGTDSPWKDQADEIKMIQSLGLSAEEEERIFFKNAKNLFNDYIN